MPYSCAERAHAPQSALCPDTWFWPYFASPQRAGGEVGLSPAIWCSLDDSADNGLSAMPLGAGRGITGVDQRPAQAFEVAETMVDLGEARVQQSQHLAAGLIPAALQV